MGTTLTLLLISSLHVSVQQGTERDMQVVIEAIVLEMAEVAHLTPETSTRFQAAEQKTRFYYGEISQIHDRAPGAVKIHFITYSTDWVVFRDKL